MLIIYFSFGLSGIIFEKIFFELFFEIFAPELAAFKSAFSKSGLGKLEWGGIVKGANSYTEVLKKIGNRAAFLKNSQTSYLRPVSKSIYNRRIADIRHHNKRISMLRKNYDKLGEFKKVLNSHSPYQYRLHTLAIKSEILKQKMSAMSHYHVAKLWKKVYKNMAKNK